MGSYEDGHDGMNQNCFVLLSWRWAASDGRDENRLHGRVTM